MVDRRKTPSRVALTVPVRFWRWNEAHLAAGVDISETGVFVKTAEPLPEGQHLTVRIELPGRAGFTVLGKVARTVRGGVIAAAGMGVRFLDLLPSQRDAVSGFITARAAQGALP